MANADILAFPIAIKYADAEPNILSVLTVKCDIVCVENFHALVSDRRRRALDRFRLAGERRGLESKLRALENARVGGHSRADADANNVADDEFARRNDRFAPVANHRTTLGHQFREPLHHLQSSRSFISLSDKSE
jgi:hypothetical protein